MMNDLVIKIALGVILGVLGLIALPYLIGIFIFMPIGLAIAFWQKITGQR
jgi:hypothetical protein